MKKTNIFVGITIIILVVLGGLIFLNRDTFFTSQEGIKTSQPEIEGNVSLIIDGGEELFEFFKIEFREKMTAFDLLKEKTDESSLTLRTKTYDIGIFIEAIGDKENGQDGKYWLYYVNEEMPMVAADKKEIKPGDKVEFKFEKSPF